MNEWARQLKASARSTLMSMFAGDASNRSNITVHICYRNIESMQFKDMEKNLIRTLYLLRVHGQKTEKKKNIEYVLESNTFRKIPTRKWVNEMNFLLFVRWHQWNWLFHSLSPARRAKKYFGFSLRIKKSFLLFNHTLSFPAICTQWELMRPMAMSILSRFLLLLLLI